MFLIFLSTYFESTILVKFKLKRANIALFYIGYFNKTAQWMTGQTWEYEHRLHKSVVAGEDSY